MDPQSKPQCQNCIYWSRSKDIPDRGQCRRESPKVFYAPDRRELRSSWPHTDEAGWCGKHRQGEAGDIEAARAAFALEGRTNFQTRGGA